MVQDEVHSKLDAGGGRNLRSVPWLPMTYAKRALFSRATRFLHVIMVYGKIDAKADTLRYALP